MALVITLTASANIFIKLCPDAGDELLEGIRNSEIVRELSLSYDPFDVITKVQGQNTQEIDTFVNGLNKMQGIAEIVMSPIVQTLKKKKGTKRIRMKKLPLPERINSFAEVLRGYTKEEAMEEARRCLQCEN